MYQYQTYTDFSSRINRLKQLDACYHCLRRLDPPTCATELRTCEKCRKVQHHIVLCGESNNTSQFVKPNSEDIISAILHFCRVQSHVNTLMAKSAVATLPTAKYTVHNNGTCIHIRGLFDQSSQRSFITKKLADNLHLEIVQMSPPKHFCNFDKHGPSRMQGFKSRSLFRKIHKASECNECRFNAD